MIGVSPLVFLVFGYLSKPTCTYVLTFLLVLFGMMYLVEQMVLLVLLLAICVECMFHRKYSSRLYTAGSGVIFWKEDLFFSHEHGWKHIN